jgi:hypothetical protein
MTERRKCDCWLGEEEEMECYCTPDKIREKTEWLSNAMKEPYSAKTLLSIADKVADTLEVGTVFTIPEFEFSAIDQIRSKIILTYESMGAKFFPIPEIMVFASERHFNAIKQGMKSNGIREGVFSNEHLNKNEKKYQTPDITFYRSKVNHYVYKIEGLKHSLFVPQVLDLDPKFCLVLK